jgi:hypothetical protein
MAKVTFKKSRTDSNIANVNAVMPTYKTRDAARNVAKSIREAGLSVTQPVKTESGWQFNVKHIGGTLTINKR